MGFKDLFKKRQSMADLPPVPDLSEIPSPPDLKPAPSMEDSIKKEVMGPELPEVPELEPSLPDIPEPSIAPSLPTDDLKEEPVQEAPVKEEPKPLPEVPEPREDFSWPEESEVGLVKEEEPKPLPDPVPEVPVEGPSPKDDSLPDFSREEFSSLDEEPSEPKSLMKVDGSLYVETSDYRSVFVMVKEIKDGVKGSLGIVDNLSSVYSDESKVLSDWHSNLEKLQARLMSMDNKLFER